MGCHADSSWVIALLDSADKHHEEAKAQFEGLFQQPALSSIVLTELLIQLQGKTETTERVKQIFSQVIDLGPDIATKCAEIKVKNQVSINEAVVIASALSQDATLLTFNKRIEKIMACHRID